MEDQIYIWKTAAQMLSHFMAVADLGLSSEQHGSKYCMVCADARKAYALALLSDADISYGLNNNE